MTTTRDKVEKFLLERKSMVSARHIADHFAASLSTVHGALRAIGKTRQVEMRRINREAYYRIVR